MSGEKEKHRPEWALDPSDKRIIVTNVDSKSEIAHCEDGGVSAFIVEACNSHATLKAENERLRKIILTIRSAACSLEAEFPGDEDNTVNADWIIEITEPAVTTANTTQQ